MDITSEVETEKGGMKESLTQEFHKVVWMSRLKPFRILGMANVNNYANTAVFELVKYVLAMYVSKY